MPFYYYRKGKNGKTDRVELTTPTEMLLLDILLEERRIGEALRKLSGVPSEQVGAPGISV